MSLSYKKWLRLATRFHGNFSVLNCHKCKYGHVRKLQPAIHTRNIQTCLSLPAKVSFNLSDIGEGIREVTVKEWYVNVGDSVSQFDNICEVQSDKASVTITSRYDGTISKLYYKIDDTAFVGKPLIDIETDQAEESVSKPKNIEDSPKEIPVETDSQSVSLNVTTSEANEELNETISTVLAIPSVRRIAKENKIKLESIKGSGKGGRITKEDIMKFLESKSPTRSSVVLDDDRIEPIKGFRQAMVKTMTESLKIPHFVYSDEIKVTKLSKLRRTLKELPELSELKISFLPFFVKAISNALQRYPVINSSVDENCENMIYHKSHNIGIAMDTKVGLAVPVIKNVESLTILEISSEINRLIKSGKNGTFSPSDLSGGTFTLSNIGSIGGTYAKPVILPPQVAIVALGTSQLLPMFDESKNIVAEEIVNISGAADHRVVDGATMANFTNILKKQIEDPYLLFLNI